MADPALMQFVDRDQFLRRVFQKDHIKKNGFLYWRAFKDNDPRLSLTFCNSALRTAAGLDAYHEYFSELVGKILPAILWISFVGLTRRLDPSLEPRHDPVDEEPIYGHLHCSTDAPRDKAHMELLAKLVNDGEHAGIALRYPKQVA